MGAASLLLIPGAHALATGFWFRKTLLPVAG